MFEALLNTLNQVAELTSAEEEYIISKFKVKAFKKGDFILREGEVNKYVGFLNRGLVRYFVYKNDEESTFEFTKEGEFIADYESFNNQKPSLQNIEAIEDCELLVVNYDNVQDVFLNTTNGNLIGRKIIEHRFDIMVNQLLAIYMQTPEERYIRFITDYADISQRIPQYHIASYVGLKPPSLSRIRKRFAKGIS